MRRVSGSALTVAVLAALWVGAGSSAQAEYPVAVVTSIVVQDGCATDFSEHLAIAGSPRTARFVPNALDPAHAREVPCEFVPLFTG